MCQFELVVVRRWGEVVLYSSSGARSPPSTDTRAQTRLQQHLTLSPPLNPHISEQRMLPFALCLLALLPLVRPAALTIELPASERACFFADVDQLGEKIGSCPSPSLLLYDWPLD